MLPPHAPLSLLTPRAALEASYRAYIAELGEEERYPFPLDYPHDDFPALLRRLADLERGIGVPEGAEASSTFWLVDGDELVGVSNLRHALNDRLRERGGHIGLGIRPSRRGQGLGTTLLRLTLARARSRGIVQAHVHCHAHNAASAGMIRACGGVLDSEAGDGAGRIQRFIVPAG